MCHVASKESRISIALRSINTYNTEAWKFLSDTWLSEFREYCSGLWLVSLANTEGGSFGESLCLS